MLEISSPLAIQTCTQKLRERSVQIPRLPDRKTSPEDGAARSGCHLLTAVYTHWPSPQGRSFKAQAQCRGGRSPRSRARGAERTSLAGTPSPQDAILHDGIPPGTGGRGGGGEEVSHGLTSQSRPPLPRAKCLSAQEPRGQHIQPTHLQGQTLRPGRAHTPASAGPGENQPYGKRQAASSLTRPAPLQPVCAGTAGKRRPACSVQPCGVFKSW